jgi:hypothetical protein
MKDWYSIAKEYLHYAPDTGVLTWVKLPGVKRNGSIKIGCRAGNAKPKLDGYLYIGLDGRRFLSHRICWLLMTGDWPIHQVDHIDGNRANNIWSNLRSATDEQNKHNMRRSSRNTSGYKGVSWHASNKKWKAEICVGYKRVFLGHFDTPKAAHTAYCVAAKRLHGAYANFGDT